jgi:type VI secretion system protein ImpF
MQYAASLFDKLLDDAAFDTPHAYSGTPGFTLAQVVASVAQDLEALLNTRSSLSDPDARRFPLVRASVYNYGIVDFSHLSLASNADCATICKSIQNAIEYQDPRLSEVKVLLPKVQGAASSTALNFNITAVLHLSEANERVSFHAHFEPMVQRYSVALGSSV